MYAAQVRIGKVRFKNGLTVIPFPDAHEARVRRMMARIRSCADQQDHVISGYAFVCWDSNGAVWPIMEGTNQIPGILVPDFVRNALLGSKIESWTLDQING